jgi:3-hydroxyisobutyrate dehydrogenase-like beta-hydroxyacid dehydrogenase
MSKAAFIGLGAMGSRVVTYLPKAGPGCRSSGAPPSSGKHNAVSLDAIRLQNPTGCP